MTRADPAVRSTIGPRVLAVLAARLLALALLVAAATQFIGAAFAAGTVLLTIGAVLWFGAERAVARMATHALPRLPLSVAPWLVMLTAALIGISAIAPLTQLVVTLFGTATVNAADAIAAALPLFAAALLAALSESAACRLLPTEAPDPVAERTADEQSVTELLGGLVNASAALGIRRATDLALSLKTEAEGVARRVVRGSLDAVIAAVEQRRPDFSASTAADGTVTIVFSDMEGFTAMTQRLGDAAAHQVIKAHNHIVRRAVRAHGGQEVELQGDGFLLAFADPARALRCATVIQQQCAEYSRRHSDTPIRVRIGLHCGTPIKEGDRFFGITVILAARIAAQAQGGEVLVSDVLHAAVGEEGFVFDRCRSAELKGLSGVHRMHPLRWQP